MSFPVRSPEYAAAVTILLLTAATLLIGSPAFAALVLTNESFSPVPPLVAGSGQHAVSSITIIPAGATTFSRYHTLQMQTNLMNARWNIQVIVNGIPAAQQSASGTVAFVNGYLLSYPTTSDLALLITIDGTVPDSSQATVNVLTTEEIDTTGAVVPGSVVHVSPAVAGTQSTTTVTFSATPSSRPVPAGVPPTQVPGFTAEAGIAALGLAGSVAITLFRRPQSR